MDGELSRDQPINVARRKFEIETHNRILDTIINSLDERFRKNRALSLDLALLSPTNFKDITENTKTAYFETISLKLSQIFKLDVSKENLQNELINFANNWPKLKRSISDVFEEEAIDSDNDNVEDDIELNENKVCKNCQNCAICCYSLLQKYNLYVNAYANLALAYRYLLTIPTTQVHCERSFSKLKYIKNRLRSSLTNEHLEAFMLMSCEKDIMQDLDNDAIIEEVVSKSALLSKQLLF